MALTALIPRLLSPSPSFPVCGKGGKISDFSTLSTVSSVSVAFELAKLHFLCQVTFWRIFEREEGMPHSGR